MEVTELAAFIGDISTLMAVIIGSVAALFARRQTIDNREAAALDAFLDYQKTVIGFYEFDHPDFASLYQSEEKYTQYRRFVGYAFTACERILLYSKGQEYWKRTVKSHVVRHKEYLKTDDFKETINHYSLEVREICQEVIADVD